MKRSILSLILCLFLMIGLLPVTALAATIDSVDMVITHPAHLANPETFLQVYGNCQLDTTYQSDGFQDGLRWKEIATGKIMSPSDTFVGGNQYELSVILISKTGYTFSASATKVSVNMDPASVTILDENRAKASITLTADKLYVNYVTITELDAPKAGNTPDFSVSVQENTCEIYPDSRDPIHNGVAWFDNSTRKYLKPGDTFVAGHVYSISVLIQSKPGYVFPLDIHVSANGITSTAVQTNSTLFQALLEYPALAEEHTHTPSEWRITGAYHYTVCTTCGDFLDQEDHIGGQPTCLEKGICTVCGAAYLDVTENHVPDTSRWVARLNMYHFHPCSLCGAHCDIEDHRWSPKPHVATATGHAYQCADCMACEEEQPHTPGPAATETTPQVCTECGYIITPAKNHVHDLSKVPEVPATCTEGGNIAYYVCTGCMDCFTDPEGKHKLPETETVMTAPLGHTASDDWKCDGQRHWRVCNVCHELLMETQMNHEMVNGKCETCGYGGSTPQQTPPANTDPKPQRDASHSLPRWILLVIGFAAVGTGVTVGVVIFLVAGKKK